MRFLPISDCPMREGAPFLVLRHGNSISDFLIQQVQAFEGNLYPCALDGAVDYFDRIPDAVGWCEIGAIHLPVTIEAGQP